MMVPCRLKLVAVFLLLAGCVPTYCQDAPATGTLEITGRIKNGDREELLERKRFYLFHGGLEANEPLIQRLKTSNITPRDCFYCQMQASPEYIAWLKAGDCESAYCREITAEDVSKVPEFKAAYQKSLSQYDNKPSIAQKWIATNLEPKLRDGFYEQRKGLIRTLLGDLKPVQSAMTDRVNYKAMYIDIPLKEAATGGKTTELFLVSNLVPIEIGGKSYVWACEVGIGSKKIAMVKLQIPEVVKPQIPEKDKPAKKCEVIVKDLPVCNAGGCTPK